MHVALRILWLLWATRRHSPMHARLRRHTSQECTYGAKHACTPRSAVRRAGVRCRRGKRTIDSVATGYRAPADHDFGRGTCPVKSVLVLGITTLYATPCEYSGYCVERSHERSVGIHSRNIEELHTRVTRHTYCTIVGCRLGHGMGVTKLQPNARRVLRERNVCADGGVRADGSREHDAAQ